MTSRRCVTTDGPGYAGHHAKAPGSTGPSGGASDYTEDRTVPTEDGDGDGDLSGSGQDAEKVVDDVGCGDAGELGVIVGRANLDDVCADDVQSCQAAEDFE